MTHSQIGHNMPRQVEHHPVNEIVSNSQDDLDNYVYEDQESGTHVLDDDIDGNDITNLNRQAEINEERMRRLEARQRNFRERELLMLQRKDRRSEPSRAHQLGREPAQENAGQIMQPSASQSPNVDTVPLNQYQVDQTEDLRFQQRNAKLPSLATFASNLTKSYNKKIQDLVTPFDIVCQVCLLSNKPPAGRGRDAQRDLEIYQEKVDIIISMFKELHARNIALFERFLKKLNQHDICSDFATANEISQKKLLNFLLNIANFYKENF